MKIIDEPQFGPMFRFNDANVYWALHILSDGRRMGRKRLAEEVGVGEGSMRRIIDTLKEWDFILIKQTGITITKAGQAFLAQLPIRPVDVFVEGSVVGKFQQAVLVLGGADKVVNGMEQRDIGIKVGGEGCTTIVIRDGNLMIPPDWNLDEKDPEVAYKIRKETGITQSDALIIGGGDGGVAREFCRYDEIEEIDVVESDDMFVEVCRKFFPETAKGFEDPRVKIYYEDGLRFLRGKINAYDIIVNDSTDPFGHTEGLFTKEFYGSCYKALKEDGIMVYQHGSPFYDEDEVACRSMHRKAYKSFPISRVYQAHIPTCPSGYWLFGFASKKYHPLNDFKPESFNKRKLETWYYTTNLHTGAFMLPKYVEDLLEEEENS